MHIIRGTKSPLLPEPVTGPWHALVLEPMDINLQAVVGHWFWFLERPVDFPERFKLLIVYDKLHNS